jgi:hypothetical protein
MSAEERARLRLETDVGLMRGRMYEQTPGGEWILTATVAYRPGRDLRDVLVLLLTSEVQSVRTPTDLRLICSTEGSNDAARKRKRKRVKPKLRAIDGGLT